MHFPGLLDAIILAGFVGLGIFLVIGINEITQNLREYAASAEALGYSRGYEEGLDEGADKGYQNGLDDAFADYQIKAREEYQRGFKAGYISERSIS